MTGPACKADPVLVVMLIAALSIILMTVLTAVVLMMV